MDADQRRVGVETDFEAKVETPQLDVFRVELDAELLREHAREHGRTDGDASALAQQLVSRVGEASWRSTDEWKRWLEVERLAVDERERQELAARYRSLLANRVDSFFSDWAEETANRIGVDRR